ncbi:MAG TPA: hypothetical protein PLL78_03940 [Fimbriimonadaceae bacterium]|nr:hypothetical protein [Fimbriimonadaceae bacterium]HRJ95812.1 hypothetical protein [Fimbriimonadaceae bacterium]
MDRREHGDLLDLDWRSGSLEDPSASGVGRAQDEEVQPDRSEVGLSPTRWQAKTLQATVFAGVPVAAFRYAGGKP